MQAHADLDDAWPLDSFSTGDESRVRIASANSSAIHQ